MENKKFLAKYEMLFKGAISTIKNAKKLDLGDSKSLVLIVDMINGFTRKGSLYSPYAEKLVGPMKEFLKHNKFDTVFICDTHSKKSEEFKTYPSHCATKYEQDIDKELKPFAKKIVRKNSTNAFENLDRKLLKYDNYIVVGVCSDICVLNLSLSLKSYLNEKNKKSNVYVPLSLVDTYDIKNIHDRDLYNLMAITLLKDAGIKIVK